jgi:hypothetical protein
LSTADPKKPAKNGFDLHFTPVTEYLLKSAQSGADLPDVDGRIAVTLERL